MLKKISCNHIVAYYINKRYLFKILLHCRLLLYLYYFIIKTIFGFNIIFSRVVYQELAIVEWLHFFIKEDEYI